MQYGNQDPKMALGVQGLFTTSSTQLLPLGTTVALGDGRKFVYSKAGAVALAAGKLTQAPAPVSTHAGCAVVSTSQSPQKTLTSQYDIVTLTLGSTNDVTANQYAEGYLLVVEGTGVGQFAKIKTHPAATASTNLKVTLYDDINVNLSASDTKVTLVYHPQAATIVAPTTLTGQLAGVPPVAVAIGYYFWNQVKGLASLLTEGTVVIGASVTPGSSTAGSVKAVALTEGTPNTGAGQIVLGEVAIVSATTKYSCIQLNIPGF